MPGFRTVAPFVFLLVCASASHAAREIVINPSNADATCNEEFENVANTLQPGDTLVLRGGIYSQSCRRAISVRGTSTDHIVIKAAPGERPILTRPVEAHFSYVHNNIEIENSSYLEIRGLAFQGGDTGVRFIGTTHDITFEGNEVYETGNNALSMNSGNSDAMTIRKNHVHHTGLFDRGSTEGEGMYLGCNDNACRVTNSVIEANYIHHLRSTSSGGNDGIEVKVGSYGNVIADNVIHDTNIGTQYPCIFVYGGGASVNTVERNVVWNCGEGIDAASDATVQNNIVFNSSLGISSYPHAQVAGMKNLRIVNNTVYGSSECLYLRWGSVANALLANNAVYCPGATAIDGDAGVSASAIDANYLEGGTTGITVGGNAFVDGASAAAAFVSPQAADFWPTQTSVLRSSNPKSQFSPTVDFNNKPRTTADVGAYGTNGSIANPGWHVQPTFK